MIRINSDSQRRKHDLLVLNVISGVLFILLGFVFVIFKGTWIVNGLQLFGLKAYFYSFQNLIIENGKLFNLVGLIVFVVFVLLLVYFLVKQLKNGGTNNG